MSAPPKPVFRFKFRNGTTIDLQPLEAALRARPSNEFIGGPDEHLQRVQEMHEAIKRLERDAERKLAADATHAKHEARFRKADEKIHACLARDESTWGKAAVWAKEFKLPLRAVRDRIRELKKR
jgi:hypothetical protein